MNPIEHQASLSDLFLTRRQWLGRFGMGMGAVGLAALLGEDFVAASPRSAPPVTEVLGR